MCCRYVEILRSLMSDNCRYLVETFEFDKEVYGGINPCCFVIKNSSLSQWKQSFTDTVVLRMNESLLQNVKDLRYWLRNDDTVNYRYWGGCMPCEFTASFSCCCKVKVKVQVNVDLYSTSSWTWHTSKSLRYCTRSHGISQLYLCPVTLGMFWH